MGKRAWKNAFSELQPFVILMRLLKRDALGPNLSLIDVNGILAVRKVRACGALASPRVEKLVSRKIDHRFLSFAGFKTLLNLLGLLVQKLLQQKPESWLRTEEKESKEKKTFANLNDDSFILL